MSATATLPRPRVFRTVSHDDLVRTRLMLADLIAEIEFEVAAIETGARAPSPRLIAAQLRGRLDRVAARARASGICTPGDLSLARREIALQQQRRGR